VEGDRGQRDAERRTGAGTHPAVGRLYRGSQCREDGGARARHQGSRRHASAEQPLVPEERVVTIGYPKSHLRFAEGRFVEYGVDAKYVGAALLEIHDGNDRLVLDHGASGAPVLDCEGRVVAVVSTVITQTINLPSGPVRVSTAWQTPNVISIPAGALYEIASVK